MQMRQKFSLRYLSKAKIGIFITFIILLIAVEIWGYKQPDLEYGRIIPMPNAKSDLIAAKLQQSKVYHLKLQTQATILKFDYSYIDKNGQAKNMVHYVNLESKQNYNDLVHYFDLQIGLGSIANQPYIGFNVKQQNGNRYTMIETFANLETLELNAKNKAPLNWLWLSEAADLKFNISQTIAASEDSHYKLSITVLDK